MVNYYIVEIKYLDLDYETHTDHTLVSAASYAEAVNTVSYAYHDLGNFVESIFIHKLGTELNLIDLDKETYEKFLKEYND